jgi:hypothetical protein
MLVKLETKASFILMIRILVRLLSWLNRIVRWVNNVSQGKEDTRQTGIKVEFIEGGGSAWRRSLEVRGQGNIQQP